MKNDFSPYKLFSLGELTHKSLGIFVKLIRSSRNISNDKHPSSDGNSFKFRASDKILKNAFFFFEK